jgi:hypothetical protein
MWKAKFYQVLKLTTNTTDSMFKTANSWLVNPQKQVNPHHWVGQIIQIVHGSVQLLVPACFFPTDFTKHFCIYNYEQASAWLLRGWASVLPSVKLGNVAFDFSKHSFSSLLWWSLFKSNCKCLSKKRNPTVSKLRYTSLFHTSPGKKGSN